MPRLLKTAAATPSNPGMVRIVDVASHAHHAAPSYGIDLKNINGEMGFIMGPAARYGASKLANILHARELDRRYRDPAARVAAGVMPEGEDSVSSIVDVGEVWASSIHPGRVKT